MCDTTNCVCGCKEGGKCVCSEKECDNKENCAGCEGKEECTCKK